MDFTRCSMLGAWLIVGLASSTVTVAYMQQRQPGTAPKTIKVILNVDTQGPQGQWAQLGTDLTPAELTEFRSLIAKKVAGMANHKLVTPDDKDDDIGLAVVVEKLVSGRNTYILVSSAVTIAKSDQTDLLLTHDVIAEPSIALAANAVFGQLAGYELRALVGALGDRKR